MNTRLVGTLMVLFCLALSGCGTAISRGSSYPYRTDDTYYKGIQTSAKMLVNQTDDGDPFYSMLCWGSIVCPPVTVILMPLDIIVDTFLLPADALEHYRVMRRHNEYQRDLEKARSETKGQG